MLAKIATTLQDDGLLGTLAFFRTRLIRIEKHQVYIASCADAEEPDWLPGEQVCYSSYKALWNKVVSEHLAALPVRNSDYLRAVSRGEAEGLAVLYKGKIVHCAFLMYRNKSAALLGFDKNVGLLGNAFTIDPYRGRGCQARSVAARIRMARQAGLDQVISATSYDNLSSQRGLVNGGMKYFGSVGLFILLNALVVRYKRPDNSIKRIELCW